MAGAEPAPTGLSEADARERLRRDGPNALAAAARGGFGRVLLGVLREPMFGLLVGCALIYLALGDRAEAAMLLVSVVVVMAITVVQESRTARALEALRDLSSPRAQVVRDGRAQRIAGREVVAGDLLLIAEGDRVPADAVLVGGTGLTVDESALTGESVAVRKLAGPDAPAPIGAPGGEDTPWLFSGTLVVQGQGLARVLATGPRTAIGRIGQALATLVEEPTRVQAETRRVVRRVAIVALVLSLAVMVGYTLTRGDWLEGLLAGLTLAMALMPEELPVVLTVFLGLGAWRIGRRRVLTRRVPALEMLGATNVLCVDKTGTLTCNRMTLAAAWAGGAETAIAGQGPQALGEPVHRLLEYAVLASQSDPADPMEIAIRAAGEQGLAGTGLLHADWALVEEYPLSRELLAMSRVWRAPAGPGWLVAAKGAPEAIVDLCHLDAAAAATVTAQVRAMAGRGLRVLGVARAVSTDARLPDDQHRFDFALVGLIGLVDPVRDEVPAAIAECRAAGIRVVMITGDYPETARAIGAAIGMNVADGVMTGAELAAATRGDRAIADDPALRARLARTDIYCRVSPDQKLLLVQALKATGAIVAMTGDGVNDAPALKAAHIGVAMGGRGTDVAREAASLVLLDDDFGSLIAAVRLGRRIHDNLRKAVAFLIAVHLPVVGLTILPVALGWPLLLMPVHIVFLELLIDPACAIAFEAEPAERDAMNRPPRPAGDSLFAPRLLLRAALQGLVLFAVVAGFVLASGYPQADAAHGRALVFTTLVLGNVGLIFAERSQSRSLFAVLGTRNPAVWWIAGLALAMLATVLALAPVRALFGFGLPTAADLGRCLLAAAVATAGFELVKRVVALRPPPPAAATGA